MTDTPPASWRERKKLATRETIAWAALSLAIEHGVDGLRVEDIAAAANVSPRTVNNYFASKYEAICGIMADRAHGITAVLRSRPADEPLWTSVTEAVLPQYAAADDPDGHIDVRQHSARSQGLFDHPALRGEYLRAREALHHSLADAIAERFAGRDGLAPTIMAAAAIAATDAAITRWRTTSGTLGDIMRTTLDEAGRLLVVPDPRSDQELFMETTDIVISGAGPNGLMLACELALSGVRPVVLEHHPRRLDVQRANGLIGQVVRLLDHRGLYQRRTGDDAPPKPLPQYIFAGFGLDLSGVADNPMYGMPVPQREWEALLEERARELDVDIRRGHTLTGLDGDPDGVTVTVGTDDGDYRLRAGYLVGCDGGKSLVRRLTGIGFPGVTTPVVSRVAHVDLPEAALGEFSVDLPGFGRLNGGHTHTSNGVCTFAILGPQGPLIGTMEWDPDADDSAPVTLDEIRASLGRVLGVDVALAPPRTPGPHYLRRNVGINTRIAQRYRQGRVFLVGDSAHVHSAVGGPGLNLGTQDAVNLGWKLAAQVHGRAPAGLLDSYESERYPAGERVKMHSLAQLAFLAPGAETTALRELFTELLPRPGTAEFIAGLLAGADLRYDMGQPDPHPITGYFAPEVVLRTPSDESVRLAELMRRARPLLVDLSAAAEPATVAADWKDRVDVVTATSVDAPARAFLARPDGYIAWASDDPGNDTEALETALRRWFGAPDSEVVNQG